MKLLENNQLNPKRGDVIIFQILDTMLGKNPLSDIISSNTSPL
jgi:hypothetical protein